MKTIEIDELDIQYQKFTQLTSWHKAKQQCDELGSNWRLPTIQELQKIYLYCVNGNTQIFDFEYSTWPIVWSSENYFSDSSAKVLFFQDYYDGIWKDNILTINKMGSLMPKYPSVPSYRAGEVIGNDKNYNARFIAVRCKK